jgi:VWFA-related protein
MKYAISALPLAAALLLSPGLSAQTKPTDVYVSVVDSKGEAAKGLTVADFRVREDGVPREVLKAEPATAPLTIALIVDDTQAATPAVQMIREGVDNFIIALSGKAEISLQTFGDRPNIQVEYTKDQKALLDGAHRIFPRSGSGGYLLDAIIDASRGLEKREPARPVIVVLMIDRGVEFSNAHYDNVLKAIDKAHAALNVIALGQANDGQTDEMRNRNQVVALGTERTGGRRDNVLALTATGLKMKQLAGELLGQYVVTYARPERLIPPEKVDVSVTKPDLVARARTRTGETGAR